MNSKGWIECKLGDIADIEMGQSPKSEFYNFNGKGIPFLQGNRTFGYLFPSFDTYTTDAKKLAYKGDVLMSVRAPVGDLNIAPLDLCIGRGLSALRMKNGNNRFLYYLIKSNTSNILKNETGSVFGSINGTDLRGLKVFLPERIIEQDNIASILANIDDKIELNNKINKTLEELAQAIFKSWFVDFEPFKNGEFVESKFGFIPKGWNVSSLREIIDIYDNKRIPLSKNQREKMDKIYPYYGASSQMDYVDDYLFDGLYVLLGEDGTVVDELGYPILQYVWGKFWVNNHAHILRGKNGFDTNSLFLLLQNINVSSIVTGAVQAKISQSALFSIKAIIPKMEVMQEFNRIISPLFIKLRSNVDENKVLEKIRDSLLPKLMSGEIRVPLEEVSHAEVR